MKFRNRFPWCDRCGKCRYAIGWTYRDGTYDGTNRCLWHSVRFLLTGH